MLVFRTSVGVVILGDEKVQETESANLVTQDPDPSKTTADELAIENPTFNRSYNRSISLRMVSYRMGASQ